MKDAVKQFEEWARDAVPTYCLLPSKYNNGSVYRSERTQHALEGFIGCLESLHKDKS